MSILDIELTENQQRIKEQFIKDRGAWKWNTMWEIIVRLDSEVLNTYSRFSSISFKKGFVPDKVKEFVLIILDGISGSIHASGLRSHMKHAIELGATPKEILEVLEIACDMGCKAFSAGAPLLAEKLKNRGEDLSTMELTESQQAIKKAYMQRHNEFWTEENELILKMDPEYFDSYSDFVETPWRTGPLEPKIKELLYIALFAAPVNQNVAALETHIDRALDFGASKEEILEIFELASTQGIHSITVGVPMLKEILEELDC